MTEHELRELPAEYLTLLQRHPPAEEMMEKILTEDFKESADDEVYALTRACGSRPIAGAWRLR